MEQIQTLMQGTMHLLLGLGLLLPDAKLLKKDV